MKYFFFIKIYAEFLLTLLQLFTSLYNMTENTQEKVQFVADMTVGDAMKLHEDAALVFSSYHLGGCSHCAINSMETIEQVCQGYGVPVDQILESLNNLLEN